MSKVSISQGELWDMAKRAGAAAYARGEIRVTAFYEETAVHNGKRVDITDSLNAAWFEGYDQAKAMEQPQ